MRVLMITSEWPTSENPYWVPFIVRQIEFLRKAGVEIDVFAFRGARNPINYIRGWWEVHKKLRQSSYDLAHAQWAQSAITVLPTRLPLVVTFRGWEGKGTVGLKGIYTPLRYILHAVSYFVAQRADELVIVSSQMQQYLPQRSLHIVPSGLDFSKLPIIPQDEARQQLGLSLSKRLVLFVGNPADAKKRYWLAREIVARLDKSLGVELILAWHMPYDLIPVYMNACDALLFTSLYEGSPNVIKEALACNLPIVSVAVGDVAERLNGVDGCMVCQDDDPDRMSANLTSILQRKKRTNGRSIVFDLDENLLTQRIIEIYRQAVMMGKGASVLG
jgi:glycosyltransferase involved in cell wall biosynthesis